MLYTTASPATKPCAVYAKVSVPVVTPEVRIIRLGFAIATVGAEVYAEPTFVTVIAETAPPAIDAVAAAAEPPPPEKVTSGTSR